jgi:hypothetical protein
MLVVACAVAICAGSPGRAQSATTVPTTTPTTTPWGPTVDGVRIRLVTEKADYRPLEPISSVVDFQNLRSSDEEILVAFKGSYDFEVKGPNGKDCPLTLWGQDYVYRNTDGEVRTAKPGDVVSEREQVLNRLFDMTLPGNYTVTARRGWTGTDPTKSTELVSNPVTITIK